MCSPQGINLMTHHTMGNILPWSNISLLETFQRQESLSIVDLYTRCKTECINSPIAPNFLSTCRSTRPTFSSTLTDVDATANWITPWGLSLPPIVIRAEPFWESITAAPVLPIPTRCESNLFKISRCESNLFKISRCESNLFKISRCESNLFKISRCESNLF